MFLIFSEYNIAPSFDELKVLFKRISKSSVMKHKQLTMVRKRGLVLNLILLVSVNIGTKNGHRPSTHRH